jgi:hypothetical protein
MRYTDQVVYDILENFRSLLTKNYVDTKLDAPFSISEHYTISTYTWLPKF